MKWAVRVHFAYQLICTAGAAAAEDSLRRLVQAKEDQWAAAFRSYFPVLRKLIVVTDEVKPIGRDDAVEIGHSTYEVKADDGSWVMGSDNYQVVWREDPDGWHYVTDMFNERPPAAPDPG